MNGEDNTTILLADSDSSVRESVALYFSQKGYRMVLAEDSEQAMELFHSSCPDLILCDINLPGSGCFAILQEILGGVLSQAVIILADIDRTDELLKIMNLGVSDYLIKPITNLPMLELSVVGSLQRERIIQENRTYRSKLERINEELERTLEVFHVDQQAGRHVQTSMLPKPPQDIGPYHFDHKVIPSLYLSGDSVDYKPISKHKVLFYIADVSGHGSSSAFVTVLLRFRIEQMRRDYIRGKFEGEFTPASILESLNKDMLDTELDKHITMFVAFLDKRDNSLCFSVAGHHPLPILYSKENAEFIKVSKSSFPVGLIAEAEYFEESMVLDKGFSLTLFSDGILEILAMPTMDQKEEHLLATVTKSKGRIDQIKTHLGLNDIKNVPDDIAVMSVSNL